MDSTNVQKDKYKVLTKVVQQLEEEINFEDAVGGILEMIGKYMNFTSVLLSKISDDTKGFYVIRRWQDDNVDVERKEISHIPDDIIPPIPEAVTFESVSTSKGKVLEVLKYYNVKCIMSVPIMLNNAPAMFVTFVDVRKERVWEEEDKNFILDICKLIQTILYKRISKNSLVSSYNALKEILSNIGSSVFVIDKYSKEVLFSNEAADRMARTKLVGKHCWDFFYSEFNQEKCKMCLPHRGNEYFIEGYDTNRRIWQETRFDDISWVDGRTVSLCVVTDVTEKKKYQQRIEFQANNDFLTGLYNRMRCEEDLELCIRESIEERTQGAVLFIDLDDFKHLNDGMGHQYGDLLLKMISMGFQQIPEIEKRCYRVGGDEFIIIIEPAYMDKMDRILSDIKKMFDKPWFIKDSEYYCTMSMGIVYYNRDGQDVNDIIKKADIAMYDAKKSGKNKCVYYNKGEDLQKGEHLDIEKNMRYAVSIGCNEFEIYIQPIVDMNTEKCIGGEALVRWNSGKLGFLSPGQFIPMAENLGLITPIGEYVLRQACMCNRKWSSMGIDVRTNVNLSIIQLLQPNVVETIEQIIKSTGVKPENMVLEVTESLAINDMARMKEIIGNIKKLGVRIALDDFGTGYSSLNYIKQMELDVIKVDRTFIEDIADDSYAQAFIKLITELSDVLGVKVCVEGVETLEQLQSLKKTNVSMIQGYYFGKPMPVGEYEKKFLGIK